MAAKKQKKRNDNESPLFFPWLVMNNSCTNPHARGYKDLGGKGITVCDEWKDDFPAFEQWSMRHGWEDGLKLMREDPDGPFSPDNCYWGKERIEKTETAVPEPVVSKKKRRRKLKKGQTTLLDFL